MRFYKSVKRYIDALWFNTIVRIANDKLKSKTTDQIAILHKMRIAKEVLLSVLIKTTGEPLMLFRVIPMPWLLMTTIGGLSGYM